MTALGGEARLRLLYELGCAFAARLELDELLPLVVAKCRDVLGAEGTAVLLLDPERNELFFPYVADEDPGVAERLAALRFPADRGFAGAAIEAGHAVRVDDAASDPRFYGEIDRVSGLVTRNIIAAPLIAREGTIGVIEVVNSESADVQFLETLAASIAVAIENARLYARIKASEEKLRAQVGALRRDIARRDRFTDMIGCAPAMTDVFRLMESAAASPISVLIEGETGTGKELVARGIHRAGERAEGPFIAVNCAALPETLLESELFGHRRGAFTGATQDRRGLFEAADTGTIFLDEVGDMPAPMQAKLLRVLQDGELTPVGDSRPRRVDVRVICATNRDLAAEVTRRTFREDLYYRVGAFPIRLPSLRERREDIPLLAERFLAGAAERHRKRISGIEPAAMALLVRSEWPGNVRELENEIERAAALARDGDAITPGQLSSKVAATVERAAGASEQPSTTAASTNRAGSPLRSARTAFEVRYITEVLRQQGGNVSRAARALGLSRVMLQKKMKDFGLR
ncbi:MAG: GAF domain-containing protein [Deltaproteobacteria bacterium]|nr:MAG: GAF domain-containing protein [Deltaproteobacteria bacterium]